MDSRCIKIGTCSDLLGVVCMRVGRAEASYQKPVLTASDIPNLSIYDSPAAWREVATVPFPSFITHPIAIINFPKCASVDVDNSRAGRKLLILYTG